MTIGSWVTIDYIKGLLRAPLSHDGSNTSLEFRTRDQTAPHSGVSLRNGASADIPARSAGAVAMLERLVPKAPREGNPT
jgi:hypothetical protein